MSDATDHEELADRVAALEERLSDLQADLQRRDGERGPRIPTPRDLLRATDDHGIPALIAILQAHIHALRLLQRTIRLLAPADSETASSSPRSPALRRATRSLASQLDELLADLDEATTSTEPSRLDPLVQEAQDIRAELGALTDEAAADARPETPDDRRHDEGGDGEEPDADPDPTIDVDAELRSIKSDLADENGTGTTAAEDDEDSDAPAGNDPD